MTDKQKVQMHMDIAMHRASAALGLVSTWANEWPGGSDACTNLEMTVRELSAAQTAMDELRVM